MSWQAWQGIVAPAGTPKEIVARLSAELQKIQATPEFRAQLTKFGMEPFPPQTPAASWRRRWTEPRSSSLMSRLAAWSRQRPCAPRSTQLTTD